MRRKHTLIQAIFILALAVGVGHGQQREKPSTRSGHANALLQEEVRHELATLPYFGVFDWIEADVQPDGAVILNGNVTRPSLKSDAGLNISMLEGVTRVSNNIEILPLSNNDEELRTLLFESIYSADTPLSKYAMQPVGQIHIIVKNGHATLKGIVDRKADSDIANIRARRVPGVFSVTNELQVHGEGTTPIS
jgi:hyperosmotically inducible periplasmic protein